MKTEIGNPYIDFILKSLAVFALAILFMLLATRLGILLFSGINNQVLAHVIPIAIFVFGYFIYHHLMKKMLKKKSLKKVYNNLLMWFTITTIFLTFYVVFFQTITVNKEDINMMYSQLLGLILFPNIYLAFVSNRFRYEFEKEIFDLMGTLKLKSRESLVSIGLRRMSEKKYRNNEKRGRRVVLKELKSTKTIEDKIKNRKSWLLVFVIVVITILISAIIM